MADIKKIFSLDALKSIANIRSRRGIMLAWTALIIPLLLTYMGWKNADENVLNDARQNFEFKVYDTDQNILKRMQAYEQVLLGGIGLLAASDTVTREEWKIYVENLRINRNYPGILGIAYSYSFRHEDSLKIVKTIQSEGFTNFRIWPEGKRNEYTSVIYIEPFNERNQRAFGYDLLSDAIRKSAMLEARDNGLTTITGKIKLVQETEYNIQAGFLLFIPYYKKNLQAPTVEQRRELFKGYVYSPFRVRDLMQATLANELKNIKLQIYDGNNTITQNLMYDSDSLSFEENEPPISQTSTLNLFGKTWTLKFSAHPAFIDSFKSDEPTIVLLSGLSISLLFLLLALLFMRSKQTGKKLSDLLESTGEGIFGLDSFMKCTFINHSALDMLGYESTECLNKPIHEFIRCVGGDGKICNVEQCPLVQTVKNGKAGTTQESVLERKDKTSFPIEYSSHPILENGVVTGTVITFNDITERKKVQNQIESSLKEKEVLLREIHHRVKNNLQIISSLLNLQSGFTTEKITSEILRNSKNRVRSMALIHEKLYQSKNFSSLDIHEFIRELTENLFSSYGVEASDVQMEMRIDNVNINSDQAVYLGLIVNELVSNSIKHAFINSSNQVNSKKIFINFVKDLNGGYKIKIGDNGCGIPAKINFRNTESLGLQLVMSLVNQLGGEITLNNNSGTEFIIIIKKTF